MMYQSDGLQTESNKGKVFLGQYAEDIINDLRAEREVAEGDQALRGKERSDISAPGRVNNYI